jgi:ADP-heptose:LPS heptosyltransferase
MPPDAVPGTGALPASAGSLAGARRVIVLRLDNLGDVLLTGPVFRALRSALPEAELVLLASPGGSAAGALLPWVDRVVPLRAVWQDAQGRLEFDPRRELAVIERLRRIDADAAVILTSFSQTSWAPAYACYLAGIPLRAGHAPDFGGSLLSHPVASPAATHQAERDLQVSAALGVAASDASLEAAVPRDARAVVSGLFREHGLADRAAPVVVLPGASCAARRYPPDRFATAARAIGTRAGLPVVVAGADRERPLTADVAGDIPGAVDLGGRTDVTGLAALVERASVVISNNSLGMHLADALRVPVVSLFSGTDREVEWAPRRAPSRILRRPTACAPCRLFECPIGMPCMEVPPGQVAVAALDLLERAGASREVVPWAV